MLGILVAGAPIILFNAWLKKQGDDEVAITAAWALGSAEIRLGQTIAALQDLSARGVDSCRPAHVEAMRQASLLTGPVKQIMLIGPNGETLCTDTGGAAPRHEVLTSAAAAAPTSCSTWSAWRTAASASCAFANRARPDKPGLAALVPASLLLPQASIQGGRLLPYAQIAMSDGTPVGDSGVAPDPATQEHILPTGCGRSNIRWSSRCRCRAAASSPTMTVCAVSAW